jgi:hypothetical protein
LIHVDYDKQRFLGHFEHGHESTGNFLTIGETISFSRSTLLHGVSNKYSWLTGGYMTVSHHRRPNSILGQSISILWWASGTGQSVSPTTSAFSRQYNSTFLQVIPHQPQYTADKLVGNFKCIGLLISIQDGSVFVWMIKTWRYGRQHFNP